MQSSAVAATMLRLEQPSTDATCMQRRMPVYSMIVKGQPRSCAQVAAGSALHERPRKEAA